MRALFLGTSIIFMVVTSFNTYATETPPEKPTGRCERALGALGSLARAALSLDQKVGQTIANANSLIMDGVSVLVTGNGEHQLFYNYRSLSKYKDREAQQGDVGFTYASDIEFLLRQDPDVRAILNQAANMDYRGGEATYRWMHSRVVSERMYDRKYNVSRLDLLSILATQDFGPEDEPSESETVKEVEGKLANRFPFGPRVELIYVTGEGISLYSSHGRLPKSFLPGTILVLRNELVLGKIEKGAEDKWGFVEL